MDHKADPWIPCVTCWSERPLYASRRGSGRFGASRRGFRSYRGRPAIQFYGPGNFHLSRDVVIPRKTIQRQGIIDREVEAMSPVMISCVESNAALLKYCETNKIPIPVKDGQLEVTLGSKVRPCCKFWTSNCCLQGNFWRLVQLPSFDDSSYSDKSQQNIPNRL